MTFRTKNISSAIVLALAFWAAQGLYADVTIRYQSAMKLSGPLQPLMEKLGKAVQSGSPSSIRMKGNKGYTTAGNWTEVFDFVKQEVTLIDPAQKTFTTMPASQLADKMAGAFPQAASAQMQAAQQALASIKTKVDSKMTGNTAEIQGVQAEEREVTVTMDMPMPTVVNQPDASLKMVMHIWTAKKEEALRVPAIRELTGYQAWQKYILNPVGVLQKLGGKLPGMSNVIGPMIEEIFKNPSVILRTRVEIYMPFLAVMAKQMAAQGKDFPPIDPDAPLIEMTQEVTELSSAPVDAALFDVPADYAAVPADDMVRDLLKAQTAAAAAAPATAELK
ncbi:MAG TPA: hypothetical protein VMQ86_16580 [Bryobacteraceae bacterium]|jgi:hypothetical protein|nr:hypothetical protein [Bryobacteraceae bacterium]